METNDNKKDNVLGPIIISFIIGIFLLLCLTYYSEYTRSKDRPRFETLLTIKNYDFNMSGFKKVDTPAYKFSGGTMEFVEEEMIKQDKFSKKEIDSRTYIYSKPLSTHRIDCDWIIVVEYEDNVIKEYYSFLVDYTHKELTYLVPPGFITVLPVDKSIWESPKVKELIEKPILEFVKKPNKPTTGREIGIGK
ncbi:MAG TPA: hypothetical protein DCZ94_10400 [Lentisphaeria bacterium]|nr:MAG: hypothetical protein A2X48_06275 [Lentisphaerae bacterium GWF2_49_21]HBC87354.1 hypothetical protein [Lentisphaeria bacterium]